MKIKTSHNNSYGVTHVKGYVDHDGSGYEASVITLSVEGREIKVDSAMLLPVRYARAALVLACFNEAFEKAKAVATEAAKKNPGPPGLAEKTQKQRPAPMEENSTAAGLRGKINSKAPGGAKCSKK